MKVFLISVVCIVCCLSCASSNSFQEFYNQEKDEASFALSVPKYMAMIAIPKEDKQEIKPFLKGMKKVRFLYNEVDQSSSVSSFKLFSKDKNYTPYMYMKEDGSRVNVFAKEEENHIKEIVLDFKSEDEVITLALIGKMKKETFQKAMSEVNRVK